MQAARVTPTGIGGNYWHIVDDDDVEIMTIAFPDAVDTEAKALAAAEAAVAELAGPPAVTADDVIAERERRLAAGFDYDFGDGRGVHRIGTTPADMQGWDEVTKLANAMLATLTTPAPIGIVTDTGPAEVTAAEWQLVLLAAAAFRQPIWGASFVIQQMVPIPADFADDAYWSA